MKKLGVLLLVVVVLIGGVYFATRPAKEVEPLVEMSATELQTRIDAKESFTVYIYADNCSYCVSFRPVLEAFLINNEKTINKTNVTTNADYQLVATVLGDKFQGTPSIYSIENGKIADYVMGAKTQEELTTYEAKNETLFHA